MANQKQSNKLLTLLGNLVLLFFVYLMLEGGSYLLYRIAFKEWFSPTSVQEFAKNANSSESQSVEDLLRGKQSVLHPYVGYIYNPEGWDVKHDGVPISPYGYIDDKTPIQKRDSSKVIIGVFGGSVAWWFQQVGMSAALEELEQHPAFQGKEVTLMRLALGGYKQPQQLMTLNYLAAQGAEFDFVINLDGYNEVALPSFHNTPHGVHPFFPINWKEQLSTVGTRDTIRALGRLTLLEERRNNLASIIALSALRYSPTASVLWRLYDKNMLSQLNNLRAQIASPKTEEGKLPFALSGPSYPNNDKELFEQLALVWMNSSLAMHRFCESQGCRYYHFLQPNQYVPNSKPIGEEEKKVALGGHETMTQGVLKGYPLLMQYGEKLKASGVRFYDTSMVYKDTQEQTYNDDCCHLNKLGNEILGQTVGQLIAQDLG